MDILEILRVNSDNAEEKTDSVPDKTDSTDSKKKQIQFVSALITYKTHLGKDVYNEWARSKFPVKDLHIAHETGGEGEYPHTHVVIRMSSRYRTRDQSLRDFDYDGIHPNLKILNGVKAYKDALKYISKEDKSVTPEEPSLCEQVWACETIEDALDKFVKRPSDTPGIMALYAARPRGPLWNPIELRDNWQRQFYDEISEKHSERTVYWLHSGGNSGKTYFMKYFMQVHPEDTVLVADAYMAKDIALIFSAAIEQRNSCKYVLFDCSRSFSFPDQFYTILERVKDGLITSTKYQSKTLMFQNSVLVVMANQWPVIGRLSFDRWDLRDIDSDGRMISVPTDSLDTFEEDVDSAHSAP